MTHPVELATFLAAVAALFASSEVLRRRGVTADTTRRYTHAAGAAMAALLPAFASLGECVALGAGVALVLVWTRSRGLLASVHGVERPTLGATLLPVGLVLLGARVPPGEPPCVLRLRRLPHAGAWRARPEVSCDPARAWARAAWDDLGLVFANAIGRPLDPSNLTKLFHQALDRAALPRVRFHDLRHTAASLLLGRGVHPKIVSEMLGHSTIAVTLDLYSHVTPTMQRGAADELDAVLGAAR